MTSLSQASRLAFSVFGLTSQNKKPIGAKSTINGISCEASAITRANWMTSGFVSGIFPLNRAYDSGNKSLKESL
jgi:hypothetical protein